MGKNKNGYGAGSFIDTEMVLSKAFLSLNERSKKTVQVLMMFLLKRKFSKPSNQKKYIRTDNNRFTLTYKEAESFGIKRNTLRRAKDELLEKGFIKITNPGGAYKQDKAVYALIDDYLLWRPGMPPFRVREKDVKRGFQGAGKGAVEKFLHTPTNPIHTHADEPHTEQYTHTPTNPIPKNEKKRRKPVLTVVKA